MAVHVKQQARLETGLALHPHFDARLFHLPFAVLALVKAELPGRAAAQNDVRGAIDEQVGKLPPLLFNDHPVPDC